MIELSRKSWIDSALFVVLFGVTLGYLAAWPNNLGHSDEAHFLYHSKLVFEGAVPYRDFFDFYTPLAYYGMAAAFGLFGAQIGTAKIVTAVLHGLIVGLLFLCGRRLGVRRSLAAAGALGHLALGQPTWPHASPHWIATFLLVCLLFILVGRPLERRRLVLLGTVTGVLTSMQQQTGIPIALGLCALLFLEHLLDRRFGAPPGAPSFALKLLYFLAPAFAVTASILLVHVALAEAGPVFKQIVVHPLTSYRTHNKSSWGGVHFMNAELAAYTFPLVLKYLPAILLPVAGIRMGLAWRVQDRDGFERLSTLAGFSIATALTVFNRPDFIHLAFIFAVFLVFCIETVEWGLVRIAGSGSIPSGLGSALALVLVLAMGLHLSRNLTRARATYAHSWETEFGRVDFASQHIGELFERVHTALDAAPTRELFCYPVYASLYLTANGHNPTPHEIMFPGYKTPEQFAETLDILERRQVRNIVIRHRLLDPETDPIYEYVRRNYRCVDEKFPCSLYQRVD